MFQAGNARKMDHAFTVRHAVAGFGEPIATKPGNGQIMNRYTRPADGVEQDNSSSTRCAGSIKDGIFEARRKHPYFGSCFSVDESQGVTG